MLKITKNWHYNQKLALVICDDEIQNLWYTSEQKQ